MADHWRKLVICVISVFFAQVYGGKVVPITILDSAVSVGAVCLDGSPPAYHFDGGVGDGANKWLVFLSGGGWCTSEKDCVTRVNDTGGLGSSKRMPPFYTMGGILSPFQDTNPYFYNWNRIFVRYCDGASFLADVEEVNPQNNLYCRGGRIFKAIIEELLQKGMKNADDTVLVGDSAGGLATMFQCDNFRSLVPNVPKCISDAGFFFRGKDLPGAQTKRDGYFGSIVEFHELGTVLPKSCTSRMDPHLCIFADNFIQYVRTPLFLVNSGFDGVQLQFWVQPAEPVAEWMNCIHHGSENCSSAQINVIRDFRREMLNAILKYNPPSRGLFIDSCFFHDHIFYDGVFNWRPTLNNKTIAQAIGDWYLDHDSSQQIERVDFPYNCTDGKPM